MDSRHRGFNRVRYRGVGSSCASRWRQWLSVEAVGLKLWECEARGGGELAKKGSPTGQADGGGCPPCKNEGRIHCVCIVVLTLFFFFCSLKG